MAQVEIFLSPGNKTSGMTRHEEGRLNMQNQPYTPGLSSQPPELAILPLKGFQCQEGCEILGKSSKSQTPSPRLEHSGHPSLGSCIHKYRGGGGSGVREEIGE